MHEDTQPTRHPDPRFASDERGVPFIQPQFVRGGAEIDLRELWQVLWRGRWSVLAFTGACAVASVAYALLAPQWYQAQTLLIPASTNTQGLSGQLGQLSGLASLAGINIGGETETGEALAVLESDGFTREFIEQHQLLPILFADEWDAAAGRWESNSFREAPEIRDGVRYFNEEVRTVQTNTRTGVVSLAIEWTDPELAAQWANALAERLNDRMRQRALSVAETNVAYLREQLQDASLVALQQSISGLLENELEKLMVAKGNVEFAFRIVDRATAPKWRSRPRRTQIVIIAVLLGAALSVGFVFVRATFRSESADSTSAS